MAETERDNIRESTLDLIIPTGNRKGQNPSPASIYRALAEHEKTLAYPDAVEQAHADFAELCRAQTSAGLGRPRRPTCKRRSATTCAIGFSSPRSPAEPVAVVGRADLAGRRRRRGVGNQ
jgi:hypothetical protein